MSTSMKYCSRNSEKIGEVLPYMVMWLCTKKTGPDWSRSVLTIWQDCSPVQSSLQSFCSLRTGLWNTRWTTVTTMWPPKMTTTWCPWWMPRHDDDDDDVTTKDVNDATPMVNATVQWQQQWWWGHDEWCNNEDDEGHQPCQWRWWQMLSCLVTAP